MPKAPVRPFRPTLPRILFYPLPRRASRDTEQGFYSTQYEKSDVLRALAGGGRFNFHTGGHEFNSVSTARFAMDAQNLWDDLYATAS